MDPDRQTRPQLRRQCRGAPVRKGTLAAASRNTVSALRFVVGQLTRSPARPPAKYMISHGAPMGSILLPAAQIILRASTTRSTALLCAKLPNTHTMFKASHGIPSTSFLPLKVRTGPSMSTQFPPNVACSRPTPWAKTLG